MQMLVGIHLWCVPVELVTSEIPEILAKKKNLGGDEGGQARLWNGTFSSSSPPLLVSYSCLLFFSPGGCRV
jgi:hypothetical protein